MPPAPGPADVHVRYRLVEPVQSESYLEEWRILDSSERDRAKRFVFERDRVAYVAAHALLRTTLSGYREVAPDAWRFETDQYGKPSIANRPDAAPLHFSLSHTHLLVACAVSHSVVGVDAECVNRSIDVLELAKHYFSTDEIADLDACEERSRQARFIEVWTLKEAFVKAVGVGLSHPLDTFGFHVEQPLGVRFDPPPGTNLHDWHFALVAPTVAHRIAVAVCSDRQPQISWTRD